jgi:integrase
MAGVGRKRKTNRHLPERVYLRHGAYYFVSSAGLWKRLGKEYAEALRAYAALLILGEPVVTVNQLITRYANEELTLKSEKTRKGRLQEFKNLRKVFGHMEPNEIESHHVWTYFTARGRIEQSRHEIRALSTLLTYARRTGARTGANPCFGLQLPQSKARDRYVTDDEFLLVRDLAPPMVGYAMDLALLSGMDQGTIRQLERRHWTDEGFTFQRGKTGKDQFVAANEELRLTVAAILRERPQLRRALICNRKGQPYSANGFQSQWQRVMRRARKAGLAEVFTFHDLRGKSGSDAETDQEAADRLGHSDPAITRRVYRRLPRRSIALRILGKTDG